ncbi:MAG: hypothetical protein ACRDHF_02910 [Tepidiformaceae bacterium]
MDGEDESPPAPADPVAGWVAEGLRDVEIAVRLHVSVGEARARRARLSGEPGPRPELALPPPRPLAPSPATPAENEQPPARRNRAVSLAPALVAAAMAVAGGWWLLSPGSEPEPTRTVDAFAPPFVIQTATELRQGPSTPFPADLSLVVRVDDGADGGSLERIYRDGAGDFQRETLLASPEGGSIGRVVSDVDGWLLVAAISQSDSTAFVQSLDGGVTWDDVGSLEGDWDPVGSWEGETIAWRDGGEGLGEFVRVPSGEPFEPRYPGGGLPLAILAKGRLLWRVPGSGAIAEGDGSVFTSPDIEQGSYHEWLAPQPTGIGTMIHWTGPAPATGDDEDYVGIVNRRGKITQSWVGLPGPIAGRRDGATLVAVAPHPEIRGASMAVLVELQANSWRPIIVGADLLTSADEHFITSVRQGPFVRVETPRECAPIRALPQRDAEAIACPANGVILRAPGERRIHVDYTWEHVIGPGGRAGWIDIGDLR